jgi:hypothetical protein
MTVVSQYASRFAVIDKIVNTLFAADNRRLQQWIDKLDGQNREARGDNMLLGFVYLGRYYRPSHVEGPDPMGVKPVDPSLYTLVDAFLKDEAAIDEDKAFIRQGLYTILDPCKDLQEVRDALPECLVDFLPELKEFDRNRQECWTIETNPRAQRQFAKIRPKLEAYAVARMIY